MVVGGWIRTISKRGEWMEANGKELEKDLKHALPLYVLFLGKTVATSPYKIIVSQFKIF
jgi:hypothetical protein